MAVLPLVGCAQLSSFVAEKPPADYSFAIVRTTEQTFSTVIEYYDDKLQLIGTAEYPYACINSEQCYPPRSEGKVFFIPEGLVGLQDSKLALSFDTITGALKEYHIDQIALQYAAATDDFLFTSDNLNGTSHINRTDTETGVLESVALEGQYIYSLVAKDGQLVALVTESVVLGDGSMAPNFADSSQRLWVDVYDYDLKLTGRFELKGHDDMGRLHRVEGDRFYFYCSNENPVPADSLSGNPHFERTIYYYSFTEGKITPLTLNDYRTDGGKGSISEDGSEQKVQDVAAYNQYLLVMNSDWTSATPGGSFISFYNMESGQFEEQCLLDDWPIQMEFINEDTLVVLGESSLSSYHIDGGTLSKTDFIEVDPNQNNDGNDPHYFYSCFFTRE
jgi:hypothetical protein